MSLCLRAVLVAALVLAVCGVAPTRAEEFTDSAGRLVNIPPRVTKVMAADPAADVLIYVLAPKKLAGWSGAPRHLPERHPFSGPLAAANPMTDVPMVNRVHPDLIIDCTPPTPERVAFADQISKATGVPYILIDNSFSRTPTMLRVVGRLLDVAARGDDLAGEAEHAINALRGRLLIQPATERPRVYYARRANTPEPDAVAAAAFDAAGALNMVTPLGSSLVMPPQLRAWNPDVIIVEDRADYAAILRAPAWRGLTAVRNKKVFLEPSEPFGWVDDPPGVNRLIGLYWLSQVLYPGNAQDDLRTVLADFYDKFYGIKLTDAQIEAIAKTAGIPPSDTPHLASLTAPGTPPPVPPPGDAPGAVNEPGRRGLAPTQPPIATTPSYLMPK